tara:strand:+ start:116 stop:295 length:180 start_codon:yes stop_codon:yes gene_type:complete
MTLLDAMQLGECGDEIIYLLNEIKDSVTSDDFEDENHKLEYIDDSITMIKNELTKLQLK